MALFQTIGRWTEHTEIFAPEMVRTMTDRGEAVVSVDIPPAKITESPTSVTDERVVDRLRRSKFLGKVFVEVTDVEAAVARMRKKPSQMVGAATVGRAAPAPAPEDEDEYLDADDDMSVYPDVQDLESAFNILLALGVERSHMVDKNDRRNRKKVLKAASSMQVAFPNYE